MSTVSAEVVKTIAEPIALGTTIGTLVYLLPPSAAAMAILYYAIVLLEKATDKTLHEVIKQLFKRSNDEDSS